MWTLRVVGSKFGYSSGFPELSDSMNSHPRLAKKPKTYHFHNEWEEQFFFTFLKSKCVCIICHFRAAEPRKWNLDRHFKTNHKHFMERYPEDSELRKAKVRELKTHLITVTGLGNPDCSRSKAATVASLRVSYLLVQHKKPFEDGEMIKQTFLEAADSLFGNSKNKAEFLSSINDLQLSRRAVMRQIEAMSANLSEQLQSDTEECACFSLQLDESTDVTDTSQLCVFIRLVFNNFRVKEDMLKIVLLKGKTRGEDIYMAFKELIQASKLPLYKLVSITADGATFPAGSVSEFLALCRADYSFPGFLSYHCTIHQLALCGGMLNMKDVMDIAMKIGNSTRTNSLQRRLFSKLEEESPPQRELLLHTDVRGLSRGRFLQRFRDLLPEIKEFLSSQGDRYPQLEDDEWLLDLAFLVDITMQLNELNSQLQGMGRAVVEMIGSVNFFKKKLSLLSSQLQRKDLKNFPNLAHAVSEQAEIKNLHSVKRYIEQLESVTADFQRCFQDFTRLEPVITFLWAPFENIDVEDTASKIKSLFPVDYGSIENEILLLQCDLQLKSRSSDPSFFNLMDEAKYPGLRKVALYITSFFGSTHLCEFAFNTMNAIKSKYRSSITSEQLESCLRLAVSNYIPDYSKLADIIQCEVSE